jgi:hypothetical protein
MRCKAAMLASRENNPALSGKEFADTTTGTHGPGLGMRYATRNHAFVPATTWVLGEGVLQLEDDKGPPRVLALADVAQVRLEFAPSRPEPTRYRCRLTLRQGTTLDFFNRTYRGVYDFADTSTEYVTFVQALHAALVKHAPGCRFIAGATGASYALSLMATGFLVILMIIAALFLYFNGLAWLILLKVSLIAIFAPNLFRWLARNKPRVYASAAIPAEVLPTNK